LPLLVDEAFLPATLTIAPMTDAQFAEFCSEDSEYFFEMNSDGELLVTLPNHPLHSARNAELTAQLGLSHTDRLKTLREKMAEWIDNGAQLAWLIDPENKTVEVFRPGQPPELLSNPTEVHGEGPCAASSYRWNQFGTPADLTPVFGENPDHPCELDWP
jgi:Uma2 family endonuclease